MTVLKSVFIVSDELADQRLDRWLAGQMPGFSRNEIQDWIEAGYVLVNGQRVKPSTHLAAGSPVAVEVPEQAEALRPMKVSLEILYEDDDLVVVDKPAGLVVHPGADNPDGTLVQGLLYLERPLAQRGGADRPGVVHRLDKETSGVIVLAKTDEAYLDLVGQFHQRTVKKYYLAVVHGHFHEKTGRIEADLGRDSKHPQKIKIRLHGGKPAITDFEVLGERDSLSLLLVKPVTGRTHQIRVHLAAIDHGIAGDAVYGKKRPDPIGITRMMLHAWKLKLFHPRTKSEMEFIAPFPVEFEPFLGDRLWMSQSEEPASV